MKIVKNQDGKTICSIDPEHKIVVILKKGIETTIRFYPDGTYKITDRKIPA